MSSYNGKLSIGDWVVLTKRGAKVHRDYHNFETLITGAVVGGVALPLALPGAFLASVGVASAGTGIAVAGVTQAAIGATSGAGILSFITSYLENHPKAEAIGIVKDIKRRWWWEEGHDYKVLWSNEKLFGGSSWHLGKYLVKIDPPERIE